MRPLSFVVPSVEGDDLHLPNVKFDFFGEPVTFLGTMNGTNELEDESVSRTMASLDAWILAVVTKGRSCLGGGQEGGIEQQGSHAVALSWAEALRHAVSRGPEVPMLTVALVAPCLVQVGVGYVRQLDRLLRGVKKRVLPGRTVSVQMEEIAKVAVLQLEDEQLDQREKYHLKGLKALLQDDHESALAIYQKLLRECPGDMLALSLTVDLTHTLGDRQGAQRAVGSVAAYWTERQGGWISPSLPGHDIAKAWMALAWAVAGRTEMAEQEINRARSSKLTGAILTWAKVHLFDATGRISEGISACANFDGITNYEGAGWLFFEQRLGGYGARFSLDREERGRGKSAALRLYERHFDRIFDYSGFAYGRVYDTPMQKAPLAWADSPTLALGESKERTFWDRITGKRGSDDTDDSHQQKKDYFEIVLNEGRMPSTRLDNWEPVLEDVLTWIPPTPALLVDATMLLLRFTLNGTISAQNARWDHMRNSWESMLTVQNERERDLCFSPIACIAASLLCDPAQSGGETICNGHLATALNEMGKIMKLGNATTEGETTTTIREIVADRDPGFWLPATEGEGIKWRSIVAQFSAALDGTEATTTPESHAKRELRFEHWEFEARPILEHAAVYAACKAGDSTSLALARSICCNGVTMRPNSPEEWWRYSIVLGLLGDEVGSEDALNNSINFGGGQGTQHGGR